MIPIKNERELVAMRRACKITAAARAFAGEMVKPGVTTKHIDKAVHDYIVSQGAVPAELGYYGYRSEEHTSELQLPVRIAYAGVGV